MTGTSISQTRTEADAIPDLTLTKIAILAAFATFVWFCAALFIRYAGPTGVFRGWHLVLLYALTIPGTISLNAGTRKLVRLPKEMMVSVIAVTTATATMLDGIAMSAFPELYGGDPALIQGGAIWLLWAIGAAAALSLITVARAP
jgi:hypothetical protein